jgi:hypothetical protein
MRVPKYALGLDSQQVPLKAKKKVNPPETKLNLRQIGLRSRPGSREPVFSPPNKIESVNVFY